MIYMNSNFAVFLSVEVEDERNVIESKKEVGGLDSKRFASVFLKIGFPVIFWPSSFLNFISTL